MPRPDAGCSHVDWAGDVAVLEVDGRVVADRFWDGTPWTIGLDALDLTPGAELTIRIVPLHPEAAVRLPDRGRGASAGGRRAARRARRACGS